MYSVCALSNGTVIFFFFFLFHFSLYALYETFSLRIVFFYGDEERMDEFLWIFICIELSFVTEDKFTSKNKKKSFYSFSPCFVNFNYSVFNDSLIDCRCYRICLFSFENIIINSAVDLSILFFQLCISKFHSG